MSSTTRHEGEVRLREVRDEDLDVFFAQQLDPEAVHMAAFTPRAREAFLAHWQRIRSDPSVRVLTLLVDGEVAGNIGSFERDGAREVGYLLGKAFWGRGIATAALRGFLVLERRRPLRAGVVEDNIASLRVLEKCGFRSVGIEQSFSAARGQQVCWRLLELAPGAP